MISSSTLMRSSFSELEKSYPPSSASNSEQTSKNPEALSSSMSLSFLCHEQDKIPEPIDVIFTLPAVSPPLKNRLVKKLDAWDIDSTIKLLNSIRSQPLLDGNCINWLWVVDDVPGKTAQQCSNKYNKLVRKISCLGKEALINLKQEISYKENGRHYQLMSGDQRLGSLPIPQKRHDRLWTEEDDQCLLNAIRVQLTRGLPMDWNKIAKKLQRTSLSCSMRYQSNYQAIFTPEKLKQLKGLIEFKSEENHTVISSGSQILLKLEKASHRWSIEEDLLLLNSIRNFLKKGDNIICRGWQEVADRVNPCLSVKACQSRYYKFWKSKGLTLEYLANLKEDLQYQEDGKNIHLLANGVKVCTISNSYRFEKKALKTLKRGVDNLLEEREKKKPCGQGLETEVSSMDIEQESSSSLSEETDDADEETLMEGSVL